MPLKVIFKAFSIQNLKLNTKKNHINQSNRSLRKVLFLFLQFNSRITENYANQGITEAVAKRTRSDRERLGTDQTWASSRNFYCH